MYSIPDDWKNDEKRLRDRHEYLKNVLCYSCKSDHQVKVPFIFEIENISYGGMLIELANMLHFGDIISFNINHEYENHHFKGKVVWTKYNVEGGLYFSGIEFQDIRKEDIIFLHKIISHIDYH